MIIAARGDHYFQHPERRDDADFIKFNDDFKAKSGEYPIYSVYHMAQAFAALEAVYKKAMAENGGAWPDQEQIIAAMEGLEYQGFGRPLSMREDGQAVEAQLVGTTAKSDAHPFKILKNIAVYDGAELMAPVGEELLDWIAGFAADKLAISGDRYDTE